MRRERHSTDTVACHSSPITVRAPGPWTVTRLTIPTAAIVVIKVLTCSQDCKWALSDKAVISGTRGHYGTKRGQYGCLRAVIETQQHHRDMMRSLNGLSIYFIRYNKKIQQSKEKYT